MTSRTIIREPAGDIPVVAHADLVVVGGGPAGISAAVAGARNGLSVILLERYPYLGGLASGGMVLVLDDMVNGQEISVRGVCGEMIDRMQTMGLCQVPPEGDRGNSSEATWRKWSRWGLYELYSKEPRAPIVYAAAFDPDGYKRAANDMISEAKVNLRLHSWFSRTLVENGVAKGVVCDTKEGRQAIMGSVIVDATGDLDVAASAGAAHSQGNFIVTTVFRLGGVDTDEAERFEFEEPEAYAAVDREAKRIMGGAWERWWLKTPLPGIVWCNCPHIAGLSGLSVADLTAGDFKGRERMGALLNHVRQNLPGFEKSFIVDVAPQIGVRQTRLLRGRYVMQKEDVTSRRHFSDSVARGRDYYYSYRSFVPQEVDGMLVAGRHYSSTIAAQRISREIPPCMAMGEAVGVAASVALQAGSRVADVDVAKVQALLRAQGADPGDQPAANATTAIAAE